MPNHTRCASLYIMSLYIMRPKTSDVHHAGRLAGDTPALAAK